MKNIVQESHSDMYVTQKPTPIKYYLFLSYFELFSSLSEDILFSS